MRKNFTGTAACKILARVTLLLVLNKMWCARKLCLWATFRGLVVLQLTFKFLLERCKRASADDDSAGCYLANQLECFLLGRSM